MYFLQQHLNEMGLQNIPWKHRRTGVDIVMPFVCRAIHFVLYHFRGNKTVLNERSCMNQNSVTDHPDLRLISVSEASERLGVGHWSIYQLINKNALKTVKIGARRLVSLRSINRFIEKLESGDEA